MTTRQSNFPTGITSQVVGLPPATATAISVIQSASFQFAIVAAETNTLANPLFLGQEIGLNVATLSGGGARVVTCASAVNQAGNTILTFGAVADCCILRAVLKGTDLRWILEFNDGVALS